MKIQYIFLLIRGVDVKAVTAFRNYLKTKSEILQTRVKYELGIEEELTISITYKIKPRKTGDEYNIFVKARRKAEETLES